jgi:nickel-dependent lactate racemase
MAKDHKTTTPSLLAKTSIGFEYDMTWQDAKKAVRARTDTK